jgi:hypothetical protein
VEELGLPHSKVRVIPPPLGRPRERRGVVAEVASEAGAAAAATSSALPPPCARFNPRKGAGDFRPAPV